VTTPESFLEGLSREQREAVLAPSPLRIIAPAGSGKTLVLSRRIAVALAAGWADQRSAALSFTRAAAHELRRRLARLVDGPLPLTTTVHGAALGWLVEVARLEGRRAPAVVDPDELLRALMPSASPPERQAVRIALRAPERATPSVARLVRAYEELRRRRGVLDLDGVIAELASRLEAEPALREVLGVRALFVDEFQDSTPDQLRLFRALLGTNLTGLTVVGDPNQAIYGWNGADPRVLVDLDAPGLRTVTLTVNYRSREALVAGAVRILAPPPRVRGARPGGTPPQLRAHPSSQHEARAIARELGSLHALGVAWRAMAVLARTARVLEPVETALRAQDIPSLTLGTNRALAALIPRCRSLRDPRAPLARVVDELWSLSADDPTTAAAIDHARQIAAELVRMDAAADAETFREILEQRLARRIDAVTLATFHRAKGLEWYHVHLVGVGDGAIPHPRARTPAQRAEEQRLLYVALTRATDSVSVSWSQRAPSPLLARLLEIQEAALVPRRRPDEHRHRQRELAQTLRTTRVRLSRALGVEPRILVPDELLSALVRDPPTSEADLRARLASTLGGRTPVVSRALWRVLGAQGAASNSTTTGA